MAYITIKTNTDEGFITLQERVVPSDMESKFLCAHLLERVRWAVEDAHVAPSLAGLDRENDRRPARQIVPAAGAALRRPAPATSARSVMSTTCDTHRIARAVSHRLDRRSEIDTPGTSGERLLARADSDPLAGNRSAPEALLATRTSVR